MFILPTAAQQHVHPNPQNEKRSAEHEDEPQCPYERRFIVAHGVVESRRRNSDMAQSYPKHRKTLSEAYCAR
jgi:hypothetical protein